jgi:HK97 family phage major capsid protein
MFIRFEQDIGNWKRGEIHDIPDNVSRAFLAAGHAVESDAVAHLRASTATEFEKFKNEMMETVRSAFKPAPASNGNGQPRRQPPNGGGGVDFDKISHESAPEERGKRTFTEALRCVALVQCAGGAPPELVAYCRNKLKNVYADEVVNYDVDPDTGKLTQTVTRTMGDGGMETVKRTGTDSLSGGSSYGFTLKPEYLGNLFEIAMEQSVFANATQNIPVTQGNEVKWPALDQYKAPTTVNGILQPAIFGGITFAYLGETTQRVASDASTNMINFKIVDLTGFTNYSRDYIVDNFIAMDSVVTRQFGRGMGWMEDYMSIQGTGLGTPTGYLNTSALIKGGGIAGHATRSVTLQISSQDLTWMVSKMATMCWPSARWIANITTFPELAILHNAAGTPVFQPNALIAQSDMLSVMQDATLNRPELLSKPMGRLLGWPIYFTEKVPVLGSTGDISFVCPDQYGYARRSGLEVGVSDHFYFDTDRIAYRFKVRHDGKPLWRAPYQQADGSATQVSPFVTLMTL